MRHLGRLTTSPAGQSSSSGDTCMFKNRSSRAGFTLPEVLVTVAIVAVLAAIVVPTVTNQISKGDDTNLVTNIADIRTSITAFVSDARKYPSRLQDMVTVPLATDLDL